MNVHKNSGKQKLLPQPILDMNYAYARTALIAASVRLHIFTLLAGKSFSPSELAQAADIQPGPAERLLKGLTTLELVELIGEGAYRLTPLADQFLVEGKPTYLGGDTLGVLDFMPAWFQLDQTLRTAVPYRDLGNPATAEDFFAERVRDMFNVVFPTASRLAATLSLAEPDDGTLRILDVAAGAAPWSAAFANHYPFAQVTALDLPAVVEQGKQQIVDLSLSDQFSWLAENIDEYEYPTRHYDLILCGHIFRFFSDERVRSLLGKLTKSLRAGGTIAVADIFLADDGKGPNAALTIDLSMLVNTAQGRIRRPGEIAAWLSELGLEQVESLQVASPFPVVVACKGAKL
jgi:2-polyprenyl-3-methyl-5-hydroxy-6-metoxy-1,4-benzoquinol methylase